ncbi:MAG: cytochrome c [Rhodospirillaceae bacterium]
MTERGRFSFGVVLAVLGLVVADARAAEPRNDEAVAYRRHVMRTMSEQAAALALVLQQKAPAENAAVHARVIALGAQTAVKAFEEKVPGGEARPEIWRRWDDFSKRLTALSEGANDLASIAEREGLPAMQARVMNVLGACKACHDTYTFRR